jgi:hypothetical protein
VTRSINTLLNVRSFDWPTLEIGLLTIALILLLERTRVGLLAAVIRVLRDDREVSRPVADLVPGDLIVLAEEDLVPRTACSWAAHRFR